MAASKTNERRWFRSHWSGIRASLDKSIGKGLPAFAVQLDFDRNWKFCGPPEVLEVMRGVQDQLENAMYRWQMANREGSEDSENSGMLTCVTLCKPSVPVEQLKAGEVRSVLSSWIRALSPGNASPNYGDPTARPVYWPETVPWQPPSKPPKGFPDWTGALKGILRNILLHVGEDPDTYYRADADQSNPDRPISPDGPTNSTVQPTPINSTVRPTPAPRSSQTNPTVRPTPVPRLTQTNLTVRPTPAIPDLSTNPDRPTDRSTDPDRLTNSVGPTNDDIPTNLHRTTLTGRPTPSRTTTQPHQPRTSPCSRTHLTTCHR
ncbi:uncharacterized protein LOC144918424 [Branchiostoma floridae x Branchiostoma belcheri]